MYNNVLNLQRNQFLLFLKSETNCNNNKFKKKKNCHTIRFLAENRNILYLPK